MQYSSPCVCRLHIDYVDYSSTLEKSQIRLPNDVPIDVCCVLCGGIVEIGDKVISMLVPVGNQSMSKM